MLGEVSLVVCAEIAPTCSEGVGKRVSPATRNQRNCACASECAHDVQGEVLAPHLRVCVCVHARVVIIVLVVGTITGECQHLAAREQRQGDKGFARRKITLFQAEASSEHRRTSERVCVHRRNAHTRSRTTAFCVPLPHPRAHFNTSEGAGGAPAGGGGSCKRIGGVTLTGRTQRASLPCVHGCAQ